MTAILLSAHATTWCESCETTLAVLEVTDADGASFRVCGRCAPTHLLPVQRTSGV